jgi:hypothetical protein
LKTAAKRFPGSSPRVTLDIMPGRIDFIARSSRHAATAGAALLMLTVAVAVAWPQAAAPPASPPFSLGVQTPAQQAVPDRPAPQPDDSAAPSAPPAREENPSLINEMGRLFEKSLSILPNLKTPGETIDDLNARAKDAGDSLSRLAKPSSMVTGRMGCPVSANGAPDCKLGADKLCLAKGFKEGKSLNIDSAEKCSAKVYLPGYKRQPGDCRTENYVTRALCQ